MKKTVVKRKRFAKIVLTNKNNPEHISKCCAKSTKISKPFQNIQNLGGQHALETLAPHYPSAATAPPKSKEMSLHASIVNRPRNGYETVDNIKVVSINSFKQLEVAIDCATN